MQESSLDRLIESRYVPERLMELAEHFRNVSDTDMFPDPAETARELVRMAGCVVRDNNRLQYHLKTMVGKAVQSVVLHLERDEAGMLCQNCLVPLSEHLTLDQLCAANAALAKEIT